MLRLRSNKTASRMLHRLGAILPSSLSSNPSCRNNKASAVFSTASSRQLVWSLSIFPSHPSIRSFSSHASLIENKTTSDHPTFEAPIKNHTQHQYSHQRGYGKIVALASKTSPSSPISTYLTDLRHSSPMRLVPSRRSHPTHQQKQHPRNNEAALLHLSSYGGGLVPGDCLHLDIDVRGHGAVVCILTQGGQRIYRPGEQFRRHDCFNYDMGVDASEPNASIARSHDKNASTLCQSIIQSTIEPGATLLYLPDPTVPYYQSSFKEHREFTCQHNSNCTSMGSVIAVDWYSSGRRFSTGMEEERWSFDYLATRTELFVVEQEHTQPEAKPALIESMVFDNKLSESDETSRTQAAIAMGESLESMAAILLHGPTSLPVAKRAKSLSRHLAGLCTRTRSEFSFEDDVDGIGEVEELEEIKKLAKALGGKVLLSITQTNHNKGMHQGQNFDKQQSTTHMVRILAESNEDIYRVLHHCLKPCSLHLGGLEPYRDRIHSSRTVGGKSMLQKKHTNGSTQMTHQYQHKKKDLQQEGSEQRKPDLHSMANHLIFGKHDIDSFCSEAWFRLCSLSDSALPVGSFAHSLGMEAASQMKLFLAQESDVGDKNEGQPWSMRNSSSSCSPEALSDYVHAVSRSNARFSTPLLLAGYSLLAPVVSKGTTTMASSTQIDAKYTHQSWLDIDAYNNTLLLSNEPGRQASMDQGLGLLRIAPSFAENQFHQQKDLPTQSDDLSQLWELMRKSIDRHSNESVSGYPTAVGSTSIQSNTLQSLGNGHAAPIYGMLSASLGISPLDACRVFAFGAARDTVSAAVRLNLVGPMAGLSILDGVGRAAVEEGLEEGLTSMLNTSEDGRHYGEGLRREAQLKQWLHSAATCAPVMDTIQPLHDLLSVRLFRT